MEWLPTPNKWTSVWYLLEKAVIDIGNLLSSCLILTIPTSLFAYVILSFNNETRNFSSTIQHSPAPSVNVKCSSYIASHSKTLHLILKTYIAFYTAPEHQQTNVNITIWYLYTKRAAFVWPSKVICSYFGLARLLRQAIGLKKNSRYFFDPIRTEQSCLARTRFLSAKCIGIASDWFTGLDV